MATLKDVAAKAGVTVTTVSRMINNRGYVSEATRANIKAVMKELHYQPNEVARALSLQRSNLIGLIVPSSSNMFFCKIIDGIEKYVAQKGYKLLLCNSNHEMEKEIEYFEMLNANQVAGVIVTSRTQDLENKIFIDAPVVTFDRIISEKIPAICVDNFQGGILATTHLIEQGARDLAYISGSSDLDMDGNKRYHGFKSVCEMQGIPHVVVDANEEQFQEMNYYQVVRQFLDEFPSVTGVFTSNDIIAAEVIRLCNRRGIKVPQKLKVVGYDDIELCNFTTPQITTIRQPYDDICKLTVEYLIEMIEDEKTPESKVLPVSLIQRGST